jgi:hypothetical protein
MSALLYLDVSCTSAKGFQPRIFYSMYSQNGQKSVEQFSFINYVLWNFYVTSVLRSLFFIYANEILAQQTSIAHKMTLLRNWSLKIPFQGFSVPRSFKGSHLFPLHPNLRSFDKETLARKRFSKNCDYNFIENAFSYKICIFTRTSRNNVLFTERFATFATVNIFAVSLTPFREFFCYYVNFVSNFRE